MKSARRTTRCSGWDRIYDLMRIYSPAADLRRDGHSAETRYTVEVV